MGILARFGLVHAEQPAATRPDADDLKRKADSWKKDADNWKRKAEEARQALETARADAARHSQRARDLHLELQREKEQRTKHFATIDALAERLSEAERELRITRDHLMVVETQLDILEGAANVLDARLRSAVNIPVPRKDPAGS